SYRIYNSVTQSMQKSIAVEAMNDKVRSLDASRTYATTMFLTTRGKKWKEAHDNIRAQLKDVIAALKTEHPDEDDGDNAGQTIEEANNRMIELEEKAL